MNMIGKIFKTATAILTVFTVILASILLLYSGYVLYDNAYKGRSAFISKELLQYKPIPGDDEHTLKELLDLNPDAVGWLTIYDTDIDYPLVQGRDETEYSMKDVFGRNSLSGSIYLSSLNESDFSDKYNIVYGHHMDNGAMFGGIDKFENIEYFKSHQDGLLQTLDGSYDLRVFAVLESDAYNSDVYTILDKNDARFASLMDYIRENSLFFEESEIEAAKVIAMSTCSDLTTFGRKIIFADAIPHEGAVPASANTTPDKEGGKHQAEGHGTLKADHWALLNLVCLILTVITLLPLTETPRKYKQFPYTNNKIDDLEEELGLFSDTQNPENAQLTPQEEKWEELLDDLIHFKKKLVSGFVLEIIAIIVSLITFILTEDMSKEMVLSDNWTWLMVLIFATSIVFDIIFFRYRGTRPEDDEKDTAE